MSTFDELQALMDSLQEARGRLQVQVNLAGKELRDEWDEVEGKWERLRSQMKAIKDEVGDIGEDAVAAASFLGQEIKEGYARLKQRLG